VDKCLESFNVFKYTKSKNLDENVSWSVSETVEGKDISRPSCTDEMSL